MHECGCSTEFRAHSSNISLYHDQNSMSERTGGLKSLLAIIVLVFPLHALLYHRAGLQILVFPVHKEESRCHILHSCRIKPQL